MNFNEVPKSMDEVRKQREEGLKRARTQIDAKNTENLKKSRVLISTRDAKHAAGIKNARTQIDARNEKEKKAFENSYAQESGEPVSEGANPIAGAFRRQDARNVKSWNERQKAIDEAGGEQQFVNNELAKRNLEVQKENDRINTNIQLENARKDLKNKSRK